MRGHETFREAVVRLTLCTHQAVRAAGIGLDEIDLFVYHQANGRILPLWASGWAYRPAAWSTASASTGNTSAATLPLALAFEGEGARGTTLSMHRALLGSVRCRVHLGSNCPRVGRPPA